MREADSAYQDALGFVPRCDYRFKPPEQHDVGRGRRARDGEARAVARPGGVGNLAVVGEVRELPRWRAVQRLDTEILRRSGRVEEPRAVGGPCEYSTTTW